MTLPISIERDAAQADAIQNQLSGAQPPQGAAPQAEEQTRAEGQMGTQPEGQESNQDSTGELDRMRARYASLQGKYNAELPRAQEQAKAAEERAAKLEKELADLRAQFDKIEAERSVLTQKDVEDYGEGIVELVKRGAKGEASRVAAQAKTLEATVNSMRAQAEADRQRMERLERETAEYEFKAYMAANCGPSWEAQNVDPAFNAWLDEADPSYGVRRKDILTAAVGRGDKATCARIFNMFKNLQKPKSPLERQVAPTHSHASAPPANDDNVVWTDAQIAEYFDAARRGMYTPEQQKRIEKSIDDAVAQGRYRP